MNEILLKAEQLTKIFPIRSGLLRRKAGQVVAVDGIDLTVQKGETLGVVGESGSGKTTLALLLMCLIRPDSGSVFFDGVDLAKQSSKSLRLLRRRFQMIFQDTFSAFNPRMRVADIIAEPMEVHHVGTSAERRKKVSQLLHQVGLTENDGKKYSREFSGGQRQRIGIARALALNPDLVIADEPVSALDVSIQGEILNLFAQLKEELGLTYIVISHDFRVIRQMADRVAVMYRGKIVETVTSDQIFQVQHSYSRTLLASVPLLAPERTALETACHWLKEMPRN